MDQARGRDRRRYDGSHRLRRDPVSSRIDAEGSRKRALGAFPGASHTAGNGCRWRIPAVELLVSHLSCCARRPPLGRSPITVVGRRQRRRHALVPPQRVTRCPGPGAAAQRPCARGLPARAHRGRRPHRCRARPFAGPGAPARGAFPSVVCDRSGGAHGHRRFTASLRGTRLRRRSRYPAATGCGNAPPTARRHRCRPHHRAVRRGRRSAPLRDAHGGRPHGRVAHHRRGLGRAVRLPARLRRHGRCLAWPARERGPGALRRHLLVERGADRAWHRRAHRAAAGPPAHERQRGQPRAPAGHCRPGTACTCTSTTRTRYCWRTPRSAAQSKQPG